MGKGGSPPYQHLPGLKRWPGIRTLETWSFLPAYLLLLIRTLGAILFSLGCSRATKLCTLPNIWIKGCGRCLSSLPMGAPSSPLPSRPPGAHRAWLLGVRLCNRSRGGFVRRHRRLLVSDCGSAGRYCPRGGSGQVGVAGASRQPAAGRPQQLGDTQHLQVCGQSPHTWGKLPSPLGRFFFSWQTCCRQKLSANPTLGESQQINLFFK